MENIKNKTLCEVQDLLKKHVEAFTELCGADDEICTIPSLEALEALQNVITYLENNLQLGGVVCG